MSVKDPSMAYSIPREVEIGKTIETSHGNMQYKARFTDLTGDEDRHIVMPHYSLIAKYRNILNQYIYEKELTEEEMRRYNQRPKLLSSDLYNTPELWSWILYINNCKSIANFTNKKVKVFTSNILSAVDEIMTIENDDLTENHNAAYPSDL